MLLDDCAQPLFPCFQSVPFIRYMVNGKQLIISVVFFRIEMVHQLDETQYITII